jgi:hypothetical protein
MNQTLIKSKYIGEHRDSPRLYFQGEDLIRFGFENGQQYTRTYKDGKLIIRLNERGPYKVSQKTSGGQIIPVIDINSRRLERLFTASKAVTIKFHDASITITQSSVDARIAERECACAASCEAASPCRLPASIMAPVFFDAALHEGLLASGVKSHGILSVEMEEKYFAVSRRNQRHWGKGRALP